MDEDDATVVLLCKAWSAFKIKHDSSSKRGGQGNRWEGPGRGVIVRYNDNRDSRADHNCEVTYCKRGALLLFRGTEDGGHERVATFWLCGPHFVEHRRGEDGCDNDWRRCKTCNGSRYNDVSDLGELEQWSS